MMPLDTVCIGHPNPIDTRFSSLDTVSIYQDKDLRQRPETCARGSTVFAAEPAQGLWRGASFSLDAKMEDHHAG